MIAVGTGPEVPKDFARLVRDVPAGAILLLGYNVAESAEKIMKLGAAFQEAARAAGKGIPFLIALDHEGGTVYRLGKAATRIPGASRAGAVLEKALGAGPGAEADLLLNIAASRIDGNNPSETRKAYTELQGLLKAHPGHPGIPKALYEAELALAIKAPPSGGIAEPERFIRARDSASAAALAALYRNSARQLSLLGFSLNLAPVLEPLGKANREFLRYRSYGADPRTVGLAGEIFIRAMREGGVLAAGKHFPGTGSGDPHEASSRLDLDIGEGGGEAPEIIPFQRAIADGGLAALMVSHVLVPALDPALPVSLSAPALSFIRQRLGFEGIILTDDINMKALIRGREPGEAAVAALAAGADMVMYLDERGVAAVHAGLVRAVREGSLPQERLDGAAARVLEQKIVLDLWRKSSELIQAAQDETALSRRGAEFSCLKKEGDALLKKLQ
jgi:beta-glucosidase-like glycosyl hydrolase